MITRYDVVFIDWEEIDTVVSPDGKFVLYDDHIALIEQLKEQHNEVNEK